MDTNNNKTTENVEHNTREGKFSEEDLEKCILVQEKFLKNYNSNQKEFYEKDIEMIKNEQWWTVRFIRWNRGNVDKAAKQMITAFKWRKSFGILDRGINELPIEFARAAAVFPYGHDYKGRPIIYIRVKVYRKIQQLNIFFQQFVAGIVNHVDQEAGPKGYVLVFDVTGMGMINVDFDFLQYLIQLLQCYYPYGLRYAMLYNVPKIIRPIWSMTKFFLGSAEKTFRFCDEEGLRKFIPAECLPRYLGGESDFDFTNFEETKLCPSVRELAGDFGFSQAEVDKFYKMFEPHLLEAELLVKGINQSNGSNGWFST